MVNDLKQLLRDNVADAPPDHLDLRAVVGAGRRQVRRRRRARAVGGSALLVAGTVLAAVVGLGAGDGAPEIAGEPPRPDAPTLTMADATPALEGRDYRDLESYTNNDLEHDNGQYFDGVTDDGLILFRDGPRADQKFSRYALMDPANSEKDWLPELDTHGRTLQDRPVELGNDRLVLLGFDEGQEPTLFAYVFDRGTQHWSVRQWPGLPSSADSGDLARAVMGPGDRLYVLVPTAADPTGDTYDLWSASLDDQTDVRDEELTVGDLAFTGSEMVWTDSTNGDAGMVHVRDLADGEEHSFDPHSGAQCNLLSFGATDGRIVMGQHCGTYEGGVRDDRVQILTTDGDQVVTLQDDRIDGRLDGTDSHVVTVTSSDASRTGTYVYDLSTGRFLRVSDTLSPWGQETGVAARVDQFIWYTPEGSRGSTQHIGELLR